jgi:hypothetical protein
MLRSSTAKLIKELLDMDLIEVGDMLDADCGGTGAMYADRRWLNVGPLVCNGITGRLILLKCFGPEGNAVLGRDCIGVGARVVAGDCLLLRVRVKIRVSLTADRRIEDVRAGEFGYSNRSIPWETGTLLGTVLLKSCSKD